MASFGTKLTLLKQRIIGGGEKEPPELTELKQNILQYPLVMKKARNGIQHWVEGIKNFSYYAKQMSKAVVETEAELESLPQVVINQLQGEGHMNVQIVCESAIDAINKKLALIADLVHKTQLLDDYRLSKNRLRRKVEEASKRGEKALTDVAQFQAELDEVTMLHKELYNEIMAKLEYVTEVSGGRGGIGFISTELSAFKHSQLLFFEAGARAVQNHKSNAHNDPSVEWMKFETAIKEAVVGRGKKLSKQYRSVIFDASDTAEAEPPGERTQEKTPAKARPALIVEAAHDSAVPKMASLEEPENFESIPAGIVARVAFDFEPQTSEDLQLRTGDIILVEERNDDGWWKGTNKRTGATGLFPGNYCEIFDEDEESV